MKKTIIMTVLILILTAGIAVASNPIKILVNNVEVKSEVAPFIQNGRTMVPVRFVAEALGFNVRWDKFNNTVHITTPQGELRQYHDKDDFVNDLSLAIECIEEAQYHTSEAIRQSNQYSRVSIIRAQAWLQTANGYIKNLSKYKDAVQMDSEYKQIYSIWLDFSSAVNGISELGFTKETIQDLDKFQKYDLQRADAYFDLLELKKSLGG